MADRILVEHSTSVSYHCEPLFTCVEILGVLAIGKYDPRAVISAPSAPVG
jgi:hypothetical protein